MKCRVCEKEILKGDICPTCYYTQRWEKEKPGIMTKLFTPRIIHDLEQLDIEIDAEDIKHVDQDNQGLYIFGNTGTGKTVYAASLLMEVIKLHKIRNKSFHALYIGASEFFRELRNGMDDPSLSSSSILQKYEKVDLLVLDDLGTETPSDWVMQTLYILINTRYEYLRTTIFVSNFGLTALRVRLQNDRIPSRIEAMCKSKCFKGLDYRIRENNNG